MYTDAPVGSSATPIDALKSAIALPGVYTDSELKRSLKAFGYDVMRTALHLKEKHAWRHKEQFENLNVARVQQELKKGYIFFLDEAISLNRCPILLLRLCKFFPKASNAEATAMAGVTLDNSTPLYDAMRTMVYMLDLAVECMDDENAPGIVFLLDVGSLTAQNLDTTVLPTIVSTIKQWYPEVVSRIFILNSTTFSRGASNIFKSISSDENKRKVVVLPEDHEAAFLSLAKEIDPKNIPVPFGGQHPIPNIHDWMIEQAELEDIDLDELKDESDGVTLVASSNEKEFITEDATLLQGMQYSGCSAQEVSEMRLTAIRGSLWRKKGDSSSGVSTTLNIFGVGWENIYAVLRPDSLLIYADIKKGKPDVIIPMDGAEVRADKLPNQPRGTCAFRLRTPMSTHLFATATEEDRVRWCQEIQLATERLAENENRKQFEVEEQQRAAEAFDNFNMIQF